MTPLDDITHGITQLVIGGVFMIVGLTVDAVALGPAIYNGLTHGPHTDVPLVLLLIGLGATWYGAACLPSALPVSADALKALIGAVVQLLPSRPPPPRT